MATPANPLLRLIVASTISAAAAPLASAAELSFGAPLPSALPKGHTPIAVQLADLDGDGVLDAIVTGRNWDGKPGTNGRVTIRRGVGDGSFVEWTDVFVAEGDAEDVRYADIDGDGKNDLTVGVNGIVDRVATFRGLGGGVFASPTYVPIERTPRGLCTIDLESDGDLDVVQTNYESGSLSLLKNDGGTLGPSAVVRLMRYLGGIPFPQQVSDVDLDGDGLKDLLTTTIGGGRLTVMKRLAGGGFGAPVDWKPAPVNGEQPAVIGSSFGDFDADGDVDIALPVLLLTQFSHLVVMLNDGHGGFPTQAVFPAPSGGFLWCSTALDADGDGRMDLALGTAITGSVVLVQNVTPTPGGPMAFAPVFPFIEYGFFVRELTRGDVDGDGDLDIVGIEIAGSTLFTLLNNHSQGGSGGVAGLPPPAGRDPGTNTAQTSGQTKKRDRAKRETPILVDMTGDGVVDATDVAVWLSDWTADRGTSLQRPEVRR